MNKQQKRTILVLQNMIELCKENEDDAKMFGHSLQGMLSDLAMEDAFGTEMQCDPRGDGRNGNWSMYRVEGIDK